MLINNNKCQNNLNKLNNQLIRDMGNTKKKNIKFCNEYRAIVWVSSHNLQKKDVEEISASIGKFQPFRKEIPYVGACFGRYDLVLEFSAKNPRVASSYVWRLDQFVENELKREIDLCPSLTLCREILFEDEKSKENVNDFKIRAYVLFRLKSGVSTDYLVELLKCTKNITPSRLYWNSSSYEYILLLDGDAYVEIFDRLKYFRDKHREHLSETCTYFTVRWNFSKGRLVKDNTNDEGIYALVFAKLTEDLKGEFKGTSGCTPLFEDKSEKGILQFRRLGYLDECVGIFKPTLWEIKETIFEIRDIEENLIVSTSTVLLSPATKENKIDVCGS